MDKVQKIKEWISKEQDGLMDANGNFEYPEHDGAYNILCNLDAYIDSLQEESVSEDLMEATNNYCVVVRKGYPRVMDETDRYICNAFKAGANWQKEQMMAKAIETTFNVSLPSGLYDKLWIKGCKEGDKLLVIKKDEL